MECHPETLGDALQLFDGRVPPSAADAVQILFAPANAPGQFRFTYVFSHMTFFKSIFVLFFIIVIVVIVIKYKFLLMTKTLKTLCECVCFAPRFAAPIFPCKSKLSQIKLCPPHHSFGVTFSKQKTPLR